MWLWYASPWASNHASTSRSRHRVTWTCGGIGCRPFRTTALAIISGVISGQSEKSIASSPMASTRAQSVCEAGEIDALFIPRCLSDRNDPDEVITFGVDHGDDPSLQEAERDKTLLIIG